MMKKITIPILFFFIFLLTARVFPNPIMVFYINEIKADSNGFFIELRTNFLTSLDGWYLTSLADTASFKPGIPLDSTLILITQDSLQNHFSINPDGDVISLYDPDSQVDEIGFGNVENSLIAATKSGQSISLYNYYGIESQIYYYYLDGTPTPGSENDSCGAMGYIQGTVVDSSEHPVKNLEISYEYKEIPPNSAFYLTAATDSNGYFILKNLAKRQSLWARKDDYFMDFLLETQIYPEDTVSIKIYYNKLTGIKSQSDILKRNYQLDQNYPNPFNGSTVFSYKLPFADFVKISVFSLSGELVDVLRTGYQSAGSHKIAWRPDADISSGLYFYQLQTSELVLQKKCLYVK